MRLYGTGNRVGEQRRNRVANLAILACSVAKKQKTIGEGLYACTLSDGRHTVRPVVEMVVVACVDCEAGFFAVHARPCNVDLARFPQ